MKKSFENFENGYGIEFINKNHKLNQNKLYNYICFDDKKKYILIYINVNDCIHTLKQYYEEFHNIRFEWEKLNFTVKKQNIIIDKNSKFLLNWCVNTMDHLSNKEYYQLSKMELVCYYIVGNSLDKIKGII